MEFLNNLWSPLRTELGILIYKLQGNDDPRVVTDVDIKIVNDEEYPSGNLEDDQYVVMEEVKQGSSGNIMKSLNNLWSPLRFELEILIYKLQGNDDPRVVTDVDIKYLQDEQPLKYASKELKGDPEIVLAAVQPLKYGSEASKADQDGSVQPKTV